MFYLFSTNLGNISEKLSTKKLTPNRALHIKQILRCLSFKSFLDFKVSIRSTKKRKNSRTWTDKIFVTNGSSPFNLLLFPVLMLSSHFLNFTCERRIHAYECKIYSQVFLFCVGVLVGTPHSLPDIQRAFGTLVTGSIQNAKQIILRRNIRII